MALTGNIEVFPLPEVLRLLARSGKNGCLRVESGAVDGRIYIREGSLSLATVTTDHEFVEQAVASGVVDARVAHQPEPVELVEYLASGHTADDLAEVVHEHVVEALYRIRRPGTGRFEFLVDADPRFLTGQRFDIERSVTDADRRAAEWAEIERVIDDMHLPVRMAAQLSQDEVTISSPTWRVLASLEGGMSIAEVALRLGTTQFKAAREVASLMRASLIDEVEPAPPAERESWYRPPAVATQAPPAEELGTDTSWEEEPVRSPWVPDSQVDEARDPWSYPSEAEAGVEEAVQAVEDDDASAEVDSDTPSRGGWWAEAMGQGETEVDTDEFLESVFSEAETPASDEEESGFSMGLLRRRRMGPVARDLYGS
ncbi:MAG TPA: DUF4388 domain-containing protein [Acidimicrobiia bacterium]|nr:DUF4388 domain-containing protein [Acidimicrobiia bacterium]